MTKIYVPIISYKINLLLTNQWSVLFEKKLACQEMILKEWKSIYSYDKEGAHKSIISTLIIAYKISTTYKFYST